MKRNLSKITGKSRSILEIPSGRIGPVVFQKNGRIRLHRPAPYIKRKTK